MTPRTDTLTAARVDLALILLPEITWLEASCMLAVDGVPLEVAARVLALPEARRPPYAAASISGVTVCRDTCPKSAWYVIAVHCRSLIQPPRAA